jgi:(1->4)-alpha-D-glucan 1-alpha-D-glucosylmutase
LRARALRFAVRFQQFTAPVAAKGVEDTAFYRYFPLASLNEVGGEPATFGLTSRAFHEASADRALRWPHTMLATSTHDNKRSEDVRCRLDVLSEMPERWSEVLQRWALLNNAVRAAAQGGARSPSKVDEYLLYQTLLGTLPAGGLDEQSLPSYRERIQQYMQKAIRESKTQTRWTQPNGHYEAPLRAFVDALLGTLEGNQFLSEAQALAESLGRYGAWNSLSLMLLKYGSPGVPDLYQGNELLDLSLVDPDNRRPVDFQARERALDALCEAGGCGPEALGSPQDGRAKLWTIFRLLSLRAKDAALFRDGDYVALSMRGDKVDNAVAFARNLEGRSLIVVAGRFLSRIFPDTGAAAPTFSAPAAVWGDTRIEMSAWPDGTRFKNVLTDQFVEVRDGALALAGALGCWPGTALWLDGSSVELPRAQGAA